MLAYHLNQDFIGASEYEYNGRKFSEALVGVEKAAKIYNNNKSNYDDPVLESICQYAFDHPNCNLISVVNSILEKKGMNGLKKTDEDIQKYVQQYDAVNSNGTLNGKHIFRSIDLPYSFLLGVV